MAETKVSRDVAIATGVGATIGLFTDWKWWVGALAGGVAGYLANGQKFSAAHPVVGTVGFYGGRGVSFETGRTVQRAVVEATRNVLAGKR